MSRSLSGAVPPQALHRNSSGAASAWAAPKQNAHIRTSGRSEHQYPKPVVRTAVLTPGQFLRSEEDAADHGSHKLGNDFLRLTAVRWLAHTSSTLRRIGARQVAGRCPASSVPGARWLGQSPASVPEEREAEQRCSASGRRTSSFTREDHLDNPRPRGATAGRRAAPEAPEDRAQCNSREPGRVAGTGHAYHRSAPFARARSEMPDMIAPFSPFSRCNRQWPS